MSVPPVNIFNSPIQNQQYGHVLTTGQITNFTIPSSMSDQLTEDLSISAANSIQLVDILHNGLDHLLEHEDFASVERLVSSWGFGSVAKNFMLHKITIQHLRTDFCMLNLDKILFNYPEGAKLLFMQKLNLWKNGEKNKQKFNLENLLKSSDIGLNLISTYEKSRQFTLNDQKTLCEIIVNHYLKKNSLMGVNEFMEATKQICALFEGEKDITYYIQRTEGDCQKGPLYSIYRTRLKVSRKNEEVDFKNVKLQKTAPSDDVYSQSLKISTPFTTEEVLAKEKIKMEMQINETVLYNWKQSARIRRYAAINNDPNFWEDYSILTSVYGPQLVCADFNEFFPNAASKLTSSWPEKRQKIYQLVSVGSSTNRLLKTYTTEYENTESTSRKDILCVLLIQQFLFPKSKVVHGKETWKFTQLDSEESLLMNINCVADLETTLNEKFKKLKKFNLKPAPLIITTGPGSNFSKAEFSIYFDRIIYKFTDFVSCLDTLFKLFLVLHLEYPKASYNFWIFFQKFFYQLEIRSEKKSAIVEKLISDLAK